MDKRNRRHFGIMVCCIFILLFGMHTLGYAVSDENTISPYYAYTRRIVAGLDISSAGVAECYGELVVYDLDNELDLSVRLQRKEGSVWVLVKKWTASVDGDRDLYIDETYPVTEGTYRVIATGLVTAPDGDIETCSCTTNQRTYP